MVRHVQRLYLEVRHAVRQLHVREAGSGGSPDAWYMAEGGGLKRKPVDASSLPGPWGGHKLHVQPRQAAGQDSEQLPKVCHSSTTAVLSLGDLMGLHIPPHPSDQWREYAALPCLQ